MQVSRQLPMMGTVIDILIESERAEELLDWSQQQLEVFDQIFSANDPTSVLSTVNRAAGCEAVSVPESLYHLIAIGKNESMLPDSQLNIALGPVIQSWRIGFSDAHLPQKEEIEQALTLTNPADILLNPNDISVFLKKKGMQVDLGALAKGYFADVIIAALKEQKCRSAMINLGGNVLVMGKNPKREDGAWYIGIQHPEKPRGQHLGILKIANQSVVTSGIYERKLEIASQTFHHIFDKSTGYPVASDMASLTIVADSSLDCEIWTTKLFGKSSLEAFQAIEKESHIQGIIVTRDGRVAVSSGLHSSFNRL